MPVKRPQQVPVGPWSLKSRAISSPQPPPMDANNSTKEVSNGLDGVSTGPVKLYDVAGGVQGDRRSTPAFVSSAASPDVESKESSEFILSTEHPDYVQGYILLSRNSMPKLEFAGS